MGVKFLKEIFPAHKMFIHFSRSNICISNHFRKGICHYEILFAIFFELLKRSVKPLGEYLALLGNCETRDARLQS